MKILSTSPEPAALLAFEIEQARVAALQQFGVLDTPTETAFADLTGLAARLCSVPMALISLVDTERLRFRSPLAIDWNPTSHEMSFCRYAIETPGMLVVPDTLDDPRFRDNPFVIGDPGIRFYAGAPLVTTDGTAIGSLCVLDIVPRRLDNSQLDDLKMLARQVMGQLELRRHADALATEMAAKEVAEKELRQSRQLLEGILEHTDVLVYAKDLDGRFMLANTAVQRTMGHRRGPMIGRTGVELFSDREARAFERNDAMIVQGNGWFVFDEQLRLPDGSVHSYQSTKFPLHDQDGQIFAVAGVSTDVTELATVRTELQESARRYRSLFDKSPVAIGLSDENGHWVEVNQAFGLLLGVAPAALIGCSALDFAHPDDHSLIRGSEDGQRNSPDGILRMELRFPQPDGALKWAWLSITPTPGPHGEKWTLAIAQDITDRRAVENALRESEEELAAIAALTRCVQAGNDPRGVVISSVRSLSGGATVRLLELVAPQVFAVTAGDGAGRPMSLSDQRAAEEVRRTGRPVLQADLVEGPGGFADDTGIWQPVVVESDVIAVLNVAWSAGYPGDDARAVHVVQVLAAEAGASLHAAQLRAELERHAATDPLTGLLNRRAFEAGLNDLLQSSAGTGRPVSVAVIDLDNFKAFNDSFGHGAGDDLLRSFAETARSGLRGTDLFARWGGEEFIVALADCDPVTASWILQSIRRAVPGSQTCSIGHTVWEPGETIPILVGRADVALYQAKRSGRDKVVGH